MMTRSGGQALTKRCSLTWELSNQLLREGAATPLPRKLGSATSSTHDCAMARSPRVRSPSSHACACRHLPLSHLVSCCSADAACSCYPLDTSDS